MSRNGEGVRARSIDDERALPVLRDGDAEEAALLWGSARPRRDGSARWAQPPTSTSATCLPRSEAAASSAASGGTTRRRGPPRCGVHLKGAMAALAFSLTLSALVVPAHGLEVLYDWDFRGGDFAETVYDGVSGAAAHLRGTPIVEDAAGVGFSAGSHAALQLRDALGGELTIELVATWKTFGDTTQDLSTLFECGVPIADGAQCSELLTIAATRTGGKLLHDVGTVRFGVCAANAVANVSSSDVQPARLHHIIATVSATTVDLYMNGNHTGTATFLQAMDPVVRRACFIGKRVTGDSSGINHFNGEVSSLKIYAGAMTEEQVERAYATAIPVLIFSWDFAGASALVNTVRDSVSDKYAQLVAVSVGSRTATGVVFSPSSSARLNFGAAAVSGPMTVEIVVKWNSLTTASTLFSCGNGANDIISLSTLGSTNPGGLLWSVALGTKVHELSLTSNGMEESQWYHIVTTVAAETRAVYVNGERRVTAGGKNEPVFVARSDGYISGDGTLNAEVSTLKIYSGAMADEDVVAAYEAIFPFLEFYWDFRASSGLTISDSVGGKDANVYGIAKSDLTATGIILDGTTRTGYIGTSLDLVKIGGAMTIEIIAKWTSTGTAGTGGALFECIKNGEDITLGNLISTGTLEWSVSRSSAKVTVSSTLDTIQVGVRYHIVVTVAGNLMVSYVNGVQAGQVGGGSSATTLVPILGQRTCLIGRSLDPMGSGLEIYFNGEVSSLKIYAGAMTEEQVKGVYATAGVCLEFDWDFGGSSSSAATISISDSVSEVLAIVTGGERAVTGATFTGEHDSYATLEIATIFGGSVTIEIVFKLKELDCGINCDIDPW